MEKIFHSGKKLALARKNKHLTQEKLLEEKNFPEIDLRTLKRWESKGISSSQKKRLSELASFFSIEEEIWINENITESDFQDVLKNPSIQKEIVEKLKRKKEDLDKTILFLFKAKIGGRYPEVNFSSLTKKAVKTRNFWDPEGFCIDIKDFIDDGSVKTWQQATQTIQNEWEEFLEKYHEIENKHLSIFALAPIPFLIFLGNLIGDSFPAELYQYHRDNKNWEWDPEKDCPPNTYILTKEKQPEEVKKIALNLSISGKIKRSKIEKVLASPFDIYTLTADSPGLTFLKYPNQLEAFKEILRSILAEIRNQYEEDPEIHLFPAIPAPMAVEFGRLLLPKSDPKILVYDYDRKKEGFNLALDV